MVTDNTMVRLHGVMVWGCLCTICLLVLPVISDLILPATTHVFFEKDMAPYNGSVHYSVNCYGYTPSYPPVTRSPGSYRPDLVFHYSARCDRYGCPVYEPYYLQYTHIDWCDLEGEADNQAFMINNFSTRPYSRCYSVPDRAGLRQKNPEGYFYLTPEYHACRQFRDVHSRSVWIDRQFFSEAVTKSGTILLLPGRNSLYSPSGKNPLILNRTDIPMGTGEYMRYLETCNPVTDTKCPGWVVNGTALKEIATYRTLMNSSAILEEDPCNTFLVPADPSLIMPFTEVEPWHHPCYNECNYTEMLCESRFTIPSGYTTATVKNENATAVMTPGAAITGNQAPGIPLKTSGLPVSTIPPASRRGLTESLYCRILAFFGAGC